MSETMLRDADVSSDEVYRYALGRRWDSTAPAVTFVMLNPSTADADLDDPTIRKCVGFARRLGGGGILVVNLFAYRATKPADLWAAKAAGVDVVGPDANDYLRRHINAATVQRRPLIAAWGAHAAKAPERVQDVARLVPGARWSALSVTGSGHPGHPLMLGYARELIEWSAL